MRAQHPSLAAWLTAVGSLPEVSLAFDHTQESRAALCTNLQARTVPQLTLPKWLERLRAWRRAPCGGALAQDGSRNPQDDPAPAFAPGKFHLLYGAARTLADNTELPLMKCCT